MKNIYVQISLGVQEWLISYVDFHYSIKVRLKSLQEP